MINEITLTNFRCFSKSTFEFTDGINFIIGNNGSGKSSLIESIYILGRGKSFRSNYLIDLIQREHKTSFIFATLNSESLLNLGCQIEKSKLILKSNGSSVTKRSSLLDILPLQLITPVSHSLVDSGSSFRRKFIDWGLFHVEHEYRQLWQSFNRTLKQRNQALKNKSNEIKYWDVEFCKYAESINTFRKDYFLQLESIFSEVQSSLLENDLISLTFKSGWNDQIGLQQDLIIHLDRDFYTGWSNVGPHKADLKLNFHKSTRNNLSRGQQKMIVFCLQIAQCLHVKEKINKNPIILIDDISAELDSIHLEKLLKVISESGFQAVISAINDQNINQSLLNNRITVNSR